MTSPTKIPVVAVVCPHGLLPWYWIAAIASVVWFALGSLQIAMAQDDFYPLPMRSPSKFGFPYPPPAPDEPGVTLTRRYMLDGHPELEFNPRPQDELWLISTRDINSLDGDQQVPLDRFVCKHAAGTGWNRVPIEQLIDVQNRYPERKTVIFIHGNRTDAFWARRRSKQAYQALIANQCDDARPVRFIIWSWPSEPGPAARPMADFTAKIARSDVDGHLFGQFIGHLRRDQPILLVVYSLGAQIALTGLEHMVNRCAGEELPQAAFDMVAMVPATNCFWPQNPWRLEAATSQLENIRLFRNPDDIAMRAFRLYCKLNGQCYRTTGAEALAQSHHNVRQYDVSTAVGCEHNIVGYISQPGIRSAVKQLITR